MSFSAYAAQQGIAQKVGVKQHQYAIAFALTDFKLQGRTLPKLILSVCKRARLPWMTLASFYVLVSRVRELAGLRLLQRDEAGLSAVAQLQTDEYLHGWECGSTRRACGTTSSRRAPSEGCAARATGRRRWLRRQRRRPRRPPGHRGRRRPRG